MLSKKMIFFLFFFLLWGMDTFLYCQMVNAKQSIYIDQDSDTKEKLDQAMAQENIESKEKVLSLYRKILEKVHNDLEKAHTFSLPFSLLEIEYILTLEKALGYYIKNKEKFASTARKENGYIHEIYQKYPPLLISHSELEKYASLYEKSGVSGLYHAVNEKYFLETYIGVSEHIRSRLAKIKLNPLDQEQALLIAQATKIYKDAIKKADTDSLRSLIQNFPMESFGEDAFIVLGDIYFSQGLIEEAIGIWKRLQYLGIGETNPILNKRIALASLLYKDMNTYSKLYSYTLDDTRFRQIQKSFSMEKEMPFSWLSYNGNSAHNLMANAKDLIKHKRTVKTLPLPAPFTQNMEKGLPEPLFWENRLYYILPSGIFCFSMYRDRLLWHFLFSQTSEFQEGNSIYTGSIHEGRLYIVSPLETRGNRIYCFDAIHGGRLWHWPKEIDNKVLFQSALEIKEKRLYIKAKILTGETNIELFCLDISQDSPRLLWKTFLGSILSMNIENKKYSVKSSGISICYGLVYCCTNLGVMAAVDRYNGDIRWITKYHDQLPKQYRLKSGEKKNTIPGFPPIVRNGKVYVTPLDTNHLFVYDAFQGALVKNFPDSQYEFALKNLIGVDFQDRVFLNTENEVFCLSNQGKEEILWKATLPYSITGRGLLCKNWLYVFISNDSLYQINTKNGKFAMVADRTGLKALPENCSSILMWEKEGKEKVVITGNQIFLWEIE